MSVAAIRRAASLPLRHLQLLRAAASGLEQCMRSAAGGGGSSGGSTATLPAGVASQLWRYDSPLLRHLSTVAEAEVRLLCLLHSACSATPLSHRTDTCLCLQKPASDTILPPYELVKQRAAAAAAQGGGAEARPLLELWAGELARFDALMRNFRNSGAVKDQALALYVNSKVRDISSCMAAWRHSSWLLPSPRLRACRVSINIAPQTLPAAVCGSRASLSGVFAGSHGP